MPIGTFRSKVFNVSSNKIYTFDSLSISSQLDFEEQEFNNQKPSTYIKGPGLDEIGFTINLFNQNSVNIRKEIDDWMKIKDDKKPDFLIIGNKSINQNKFLLVSVNVSEITLNNDGHIQKASVELKLKEFVRSGSKSSPGTTTSSKKSKKRSNPNVELSKEHEMKITSLEDELWGA